ncbi:MAG: type IX secretion system sortase PorU [Flavobacteriales bacterium]|nr:type IX secretion system sortase PorU [Flavobacteriales bacterium]
MERGGLPIFHEVLPLNSRVTGITVHLQNARFVPLTAAEREAWPATAEAGSEPLVMQQLAYHRKQPHAIVTIEPFRREPSTGVIEKLVAFRFELVESTGGVGHGRPKSYPDHSKLASGEWYRFTVPKDGVYKMTYEFVRDLGVNMTGLVSDRINLYGNHFGMLPFQNAVPRATDLKVNAIEVVDGGDGNFSAGDYILFYATGAQRWDLNDTMFKHTKNVYSDSASYFIGLDVEDPVRIMPAALSQDSPTRTVTTFRDRQVIDRDLVNLIKSGRTWFGEVFDITTTYTYNFDTPNLVSTVPLVLEFDGAARTLNSGVVVNYSSFAVNSGSNFSTTFQVQGVSNSFTGPLGRMFHQNMSWMAGGSNVPVTVTFNKFDPLTSVGWMNYLRLNCTRELRMVGDQMMFRDLSSVGPGEISEFVLDQASSAQRIWEITDPTNVQRIDYQVAGSQKLFRLGTDTLRQFIAFRDANYLTPVRVGRVASQDLHATILPTDLVIVCPPEFWPYAQRLADRRASEGLTVRMVSPQQVYNEFSSGSRDATAIKRYMRMLYDRAGNDPDLMPRYLLLFGDGSYNNISQSFNNQGWIPSYQTEDSMDPSRSYTSDDYFGLLDEQEGDSTADLVDIGIGRIVAHTAEQAREVVDKILAYDRLQLLDASGTSCSATGDGGIADWRTHVLFVSDDQEGDGFEGIIHMDQSDFLARRVELEHPFLNIEKLYMDAYQQITTPGGERYPQAILDLKEKVQKGLLLVNYVGHGGEVGWAHERLLDNTTILGWTNKNRLPLFMTATCEFSRWDDPGRTSAGELVLLNPNGGGIALMSTTRLAYSSQNFALAQDFYDYAFSATDEVGRDNRLGDIYRRTKVAISTAQPTLRNHRNFTLLGDPSMRLAIPRQTLRITSVTDTMGMAVDTLKALSVVRISGFVDDGSGQPMQGFNGVVIPIVYDKAQQQFTLANDGGSPFPFWLRKSVIYRGRASVTNGQFNFTFIVPRDINYQVGPGRIACYAESMTTNASGYDNDRLVGGANDDVAVDEQGPRIDLYLNDELFVRGGITNEDPMLFAKLFDENGINTVGSSIGHDLLATLDENTEQAVVLNDLYEADLDTYRSGQVRYRFADLAEGTHTLRMKAWDAFNNSSESTTEFVVAPSAELALAHVLNYPNPFTTYTQFFFEHNRPCNTLDVQVQVFTVSGRLVKTIGQRVTCDGFRGDPMAWDGRDDFGDKLGRGVYVYRLKISTSDGENAEKFEKLVILR